MKSVEAVAVDGKTLRGIHGEQLPGVHLVAAYAHQQWLDGRQGELGALPALLDRLDIGGRVVKLNSPKGRSAKI